MDLQNILQKQQQTLQMMSHLSKTLHDTAMAIIRRWEGEPSPDPAPRAAPEGVESGDLDCGDYTVWRDEVIDSSSVSSAAVVAIESMTMVEGSISLVGAAILGVEIAEH